jgi:quercetin dioxygenase-like cupin family protein
VPAEALRGGGKADRFRDLASPPRVRHAPFVRFSELAKRKFKKGATTMNDLVKGITENGTGYDGVTWNVLGQTYYPKAEGETTFAFETNSEPGQFVPVHIHATQDEFILVQEGELDLKLDGVWSKAKAGDLVRMPMGIPHGYFNKSDKPVRALFWVSPAGTLRDLFSALDNLTDVARVVELSATHGVEFLPEEANA